MSYGVERIISDDTHAGSDTVAAFQKEGLLFFCNFCFPKR